MRYKVVPEPRGLETLRAARAAVPLVPNSVEDCCTRVVDRTDVFARDEAREWMTFMQALELVEETPRGFRRTRDDRDVPALADAFERRVFGAAELLDAMEAREAVTVDDAFQLLRAAVPGWERSRHADWKAEWRERVRRLLEWSVTFGLVRNESGSFVLAYVDE